MGLIFIPVSSLNRTHNHIRYKWYTYYENVKRPKQIVTFFARNITFTMFLVCIYHRHQTVNDSDDGDSNYGSSTVTEIYELNCIAEI